MTPSSKKSGTRLQGTEKKPKRTLTPRERSIRNFFIVSSVISLLIILPFLAYKIWVKPPTMAPPIERPGPNEPGTEPDQSEDTPGHTVEDRKKDYYTFLLVGRDTFGGGNTDTMMLAAYDVANQKLNVMSLPRDTLVNVSWDIKKLNSVYNMYGGKEKGMAALKKEVGELVGFQPDFTVTVEWEAVGKLVDAVGGVYFDVPRRMYYNDLSQNFKIDLKKGPQTLSGKQAMQLLRYRHDSDDNGNILNSGYPDGDLGRIKVQQAFLKATISQCLEKIGDMDKVGKLAKIFLDNVKTELNLGHLIWFGQAAIFGSNGSGRLSMEDVSFLTMPWVSANQVRSRTYNNHPSYVAPNVDEIVKLVNESFNPYTTPLKKSELDVMFVNKDGTLGTTGGKLQDTKYNSWILSRGGSSGSSTPKPNPSTPPTEAPVPSQEPVPTVTPTPPVIPPSVSPTPSHSTPPVSPSPSHSTPPIDSPAPSETPPPGIPND